MSFLRVILRSFLMKSVLLVSANISFFSRVLGAVCNDTSGISEGNCNNGCCSGDHPLYGIDDRTMMFVGLSVICTCFILTIAIVVCCFWSRCPMYNMCRVTYSRADIIAESKEDDPLNSVMPPEDTYGQNYYSPQVKMTAFEDV